MVTPLKIARVTSGIKQWKLAQLLGIRPSELSNMEAGRVNVRIQLRYKLAEILKVPVEKLFPKEEL